MTGLIHMIKLIGLGLILPISGMAQSFEFETLSEEKKSKRHPRIAHVLSHYIQIESESGNEGLAGAFLANECESRGLHIRRFTEEKDSYNFAASIYPLNSGKPNIVLLNHIDVVSHGHDDDWTHPPYSGAIEDGMVWGRGAIDNKGMAIMQLEAISDFIEISKRENLPFNLTLLSVSSEEVGGEKGAKIMADSFLHELNPVVILGEGGSGVSGIVSSNEDKVVYGVSTAHKRGLWLKLSLDMHTSGHGSVPPKEYVNREMVEALARLNRKKQKIAFSQCTKDMFQSLGELEGGIKGFILKNIGLFKPLVGPVLRKEDIISSLVTNTITLTNMSNPPASVNVISQNAEAILDCRLLPETDTDKFLSDIKKALKDDRIEIEIINETVRAYCSRRNDYFDVLSKSIKEIDKDAGVVPILFPAFNDNNYFRAKGIQVFGILPVHLDMDMVEGIHNSDERISIESLQKGRDIYRHFLFNMMDSGLEPRTITLTNE